MDHPSERRKHPRLAAVRPCKVLRHEGRSYTFARTSDYSLGGVLMEIVAARPLCVGDRLSVAIAWGDEPIIPTKSLIPAAVVRAGMMIEGKQRVAVRFDEIMSDARAA